jgi:predicted metal-dependent hydrolase
MAALSHSGERTRGGPPHKTVQNKPMSLFVDQSEINSVLWKACDTFRGTIDASEYERIAACLERVTPFGVTHPGDFKLKRMEKRWGSCTADGTIYLNPYLIGAPKECIDYVITHELIHTVHLHHKRQFYALLSRCFPDWQTVRTKLNASMELPHVNR